MQKADIETVFIVFDTYNFVNFLRKYDISMNYLFKMATIPLVSSVTFSEQGTFLENLLLHTKHFLRVANTSAHLFSTTVTFSFSVSTKIVTYPLKATPFFNPASVLLNFFMNRVSNVG